MSSPARSLPTTARSVSSPLTRSPARLAPCAPAHCARAVPSPPPTRAVSSPVCAITTVMASSSALAAPSPSSIEPAPPPSLPSPVSSVLLSLVAFDQIALALKVRRSVTSLAHTCSSPIAIGGLAGDFTVASTRQRAVDRPPQASTGQIDPISMTPYPRPCLATTPPSQNWIPGGEPPWDFTGDRTPAGFLSPCHRSTPSATPSSGMWTHATAPSPRHPHAVSPAGGMSGPPTHAVAHALAPGWPKNSPRPS
jgi:hypothetical protein